MRATVNQNGVVGDRSDYLPFGLRINADGAATTNRYLYNGKELQATGTLKYLDYGARFYDPTIGRWSTQDPLAEKYYSFGPYIFCLGDPVKFVDLKGTSVKIYYKGKDGVDRYFIYSGQNTSHENTFVNQVIEAYEFNKKNGGGDATILAVEGDKIIPIVEHDESQHYEGAVFWHPELGTVTDKNVVLSPATVLDHELDHATFRAYNYKQYQDGRVNDSQYNSKEERRVITGSEQKTAKANGEIQNGQVTRTNHKGKSVITKGVTSHEIDRQKTLEYEKQQEKRGYDWPEW